MMFRPCGLMLILLLAMLAIPLASLATEEPSALLLKVQPSIVTVLVYDRDGDLCSQGSGFFIDKRMPDGTLRRLLVTCRFILEGGQKAVLQTSQGQKYSVTAVVADDKSDDLILLETDAPASVCRPLPLTTMDPVAGTKVMIIGGPQGKGRTISDGVLLSTREFFVEKKPYLLTAPISHDSSGGPVLNLQGEVLGVMPLQLTEETKVIFAKTSARVLDLKPGKPYTIAQWTDENHGDQDIIGGRALYMMKMGNFKGAIQLYQRLTKESPTDALHWSGLGECYIGLSRYQEAVDAFKQAIRLKPDIANVYYQIGIAYKNLGSYQDAVDAYKQAIRLKPDYIEAYCDLGWVYNIRKQYQEAMDLCKQAIRLKPDSAEIYFCIGMAYNYQGNYQDAVIASKQAIRLNSDLVDAYDCLSLAYYHLKRYQEAVEVCKQAIRMKQDDINAYDCLALVYYHMKRYQEAVEVCKQAIRMKPDDAQAYSCIGWAYCFLGRYQEAIDTLTQAIRLLPDKPDNHAFIGMAYLQLGDKSKALDEYRILKDLDKDLADGLYKEIYP